MKRLLLLGLLLLSGCATEVAIGPPPPYNYYYGPSYDTYYGIIAPGPSWYWQGNNWYHGYWRHDHGWRN